MFPIMMIYLVLVLIRPQDYPALQGAIPIPMQQVALLLAGVAWLMSGRRMNSAPQNLLLLVFMLAMMVSVAFNGWVGGAVPIFRYFAPVVLSYFLLCNAINTRGKMKVAMAVFSLCATVLAIHGIEQARTGVGWTGMTLSQGTRIQYVGIFSDPNDLGMLFVMSVPMAVYLAQGGGWLGLKRVFWWAVTATLVYGIYLTDSRGTILALLCIFGVYVWLTRGLVLAGTLGAVALVGLMAMPSSRMQELEVGEESAMDRVYSWYEGMQMFKDSPIFGVGTGAYTEIYQLTAHNSLVLVLAEMGIVGFTLWLMFMGYSFWMMIRIMRWRPTAAMLEHDAELFTQDVIDEWVKDRAVAFVLLLSLCAFAVCAFFLSRTYVALLYLFTALVVAHFAWVRRRHPWVPDLKLTNHLLLWPAASVAAAVGLYMVVRVLLVLA